MIYGEWVAVAAARCVARVLISWMMTGDLSYVGGGLLFTWVSLMGWCSTCWGGGIVRSIRDLLDGVCEARFSFRRFVVARFSVGFAPLSWEG